MKSDWEYKEEVLLTIAWKQEGYAPAFDFFNFEQIVNNLPDKQSLINCKLNSSAWILYKLFINFIESFIS